MKWHLVQTNRTDLRICPDYKGQPSGIALSIGSRALSFVPHRTGSRRGEKMVYRDFTPEDMEIARLITASPELLDAAKFALSVLKAGGGFELSERLAMGKLEIAIAVADGRPAPSVLGDAPRCGECMDTLVDKLGTGAPNYCDTCDREVSNAS